MAAANSDSNEGRFSSNFRFIHKYRRHKKMARLTEALCGPLNSRVK